MIKKMIVIEDCMECPIIKGCTAWKSLTAKQRFTLKCGAGVGKFILKGCHLSDAPEMDLQSTAIPAPPQACA